MRQVRFVLGAILVLGAAGCGGQLSYSVAVSADTLESSLSEYFPLSSEKWVEQKTPVVVTLSDPEVLLEEGKDRFGFRVQVELQREQPPADPKPPMPEPGPPGPLPAPSAPAGSDTVEGSVTLSGEIKYRPEEGAFYVLNPTLDEVQLDVLPEQMQAPARQVTERALKKFFAENAVYTLSGDDMKTRAARSLLMSAKVIDGELKLELAVGSAN